MPADRAPFRGGRTWLLAWLCLLLWAAPAGAQDAALARLFDEEGLAGTLVIAALHGGQEYVHDGARADRRLPCASTFKVLNTLIALEEHAIAGEHDLLRWDGVPRELPDWNRDQTLASAFRVSCVWCYQELARRVGADKYPRYLREAGYGELREPFDGTAFWLDGSLVISAREQVEFLRRLYLRTLPYRPENYDTLSRIMLAERTPGHALWAKTGWASRAQPQIGWYVGYVEARGAVWLFALNLDMRGPQDLPVRQRIVRAALHAKGIID